MADLDEKHDKIDNRSTKDILLELLNEFEACCGDFFENVSKVAVQVVPRKQEDDLFNSKTLDKLIEKHNQIQATAQIAQDQHNRHSEIVKAKEELAKKNQEILQLHGLLNETEQLLSNALFQAKKKHTAIEKASKNKITSEELIKYAHRISSSCAVEAPPNWIPGDPRRPYPQDIEMRSGWLGQMQERMVPGLQEQDQGDGVNVQTFSSEQDILLDNLSSTVLNGHTDSSNANSGTWRSALNTSNNVIESSSSHPGFLGADIQMDIPNGLMEGVREVDVEQMSTSSSSTSSDSL